MNDSFKFMSGMVVVILSSMVAGYLINDALEFSKKFDGLRFVADNHTEALGTAYGYDSGDWVCVNVKDMQPERALEVCKHEVGHEIFSTLCEENWTKCLEVVK